MFKCHKKSFSSWLAYQAIASRTVYGSSYSLCVSEKELLENGYGDIAARLLNEEKAVRDSGYLYIDPYFEQYDKDSYNRKGKLLKTVKSESFQAMINQSELTCYNSSEYAGMFFRISQKDLRRYGCIQIAAQLIRQNLAFLDMDDETLYININYMNSLEKTSKIPSDLSGFQSILGEGNTLKNILDLIEESELIRMPDNQHKIRMSQEVVKDYGFQTQFLSLVHLGIAEIGENGDYLLTPEFSSWLLDYVDHAGDRMSFAGLYEEMI